MTKDIQIIYFDEKGNVTNKEKAKRANIRIMENGLLVEEIFGNLSD